MSADIHRLVGLRLTNVQIRDYSWYFSFGAQAVIGTETLWRFIDDGRIRVTSCDDGARFGLPGRIDAAKFLMAAAQELVIEAVTIHPDTGDLSISFGDARLEFHQTSSGYEAWRLELQGRKLLCLGGGEMLSH